jgi:hypothetical protein
MTTIEAMPGRIETFRVLAGGMTLVGYIRMAREAAALRWVARDLGSKDRAACIRSFYDKGRAVEWLVAREPAPSEPGRSPYAAPGNRRVVAA